MNMYLGYGDKARLGVIHTSTHPGWTDPENVLDETPGIKATASGYSATAYTLDVDLGVPHSIDCWGVIGHTLYTKGYSEIQLRVGSTDNGSVYNIEASSIGSIQSYPGYEPNVLRTMGSPTTKRYWRFQTSPSPDTSALEIGVVLLGSYLVVPVPAPPWPERGRDQVLVAGAIGGTAGRVDKGESHVETGLRWERMEAAEKDDLVAIWETQRGRLQPLCYASHHSASRISRGRIIEDVRYATIEDLVVRHVLPAGLYNVSAVLRELV